MVYVHDAFGYACICMSYFVGVLCVHTYMRSLRNVLTRVYFVSVCALLWVYPIINSKITWRCRACISMSFRACDRSMCVSACVTLCKMHASVCGVYVECLFCDIAWVSVCVHVVGCVCAWVLFVVCCVYPTRLSCVCAQEKSVCGGTRTSNR